MAVLGYIPSENPSANSYGKARIVIMETATNTANNTSTVKIEFQVYPTSLGAAYNIGGTIVVNGSSTTLSGSTGSVMSSGKWTVAWSKEYTITHDANGSKSIVVSTTSTSGYGNGLYAYAYYNGTYYALSTGTGNKTVNLAPITRNFTVTFNANGGTVTTSSKTVTNGSTYGDLPTPTWTGHRFDGWFTATSGGTQITSSTSVTITAAQTLYAHWTAIDSTVRFVIDETNSAWTSITVTYGQTYGARGTWPSNPTKTGYSFSGWYTERSGGTQITSSSTVSITSTQTLYARWTANSYTVTFNANGGSVSPTSKSVAYNGTYGDLPTPTKSGYSFLGWFTAETNGTQITSTSSVTITAAQTLYAHWKISSFIAVGPSLTKAVPYVYTGGRWVEAVAYVHTGGSWKRS